MRDLSSRKWFDYRFTSPLKSTMLFARLYQGGFREYIRRNVDSALAKNVTGISIRVPDNPNSAFTQLWKARQQADALGFPYELVIHFGFEFASRRTWKQPPRPMQLFSNRKTETTWWIELEKYLGEHLPPAVEALSTLQQYRLEHDRRLPAQEAFRSFMWDYLKSSTGSWSTKIGRQCIEKRQLPLQSVLDLIEPELRPGVVGDIRRDVELGLIQPEAKVDLPVIEFAPPCLGLRDAREAGSAECASCHLAAECAGIADIVAKRLMAKHGVLSPVANGRLVNRRQKTNERVRRHRQKKKGLAEACC